MTVWADWQGHSSTYDRRTQDCEHATQRGSQHTKADRLSGSNRTKRLSCLLGFPRCRDDDAGRPDRRGSSPRIGRRVRCHGDGQGCSQSSRYPPPAGGRARSGLGRCLTRPSGEVGRAARWFHLRRQPSRPVEQEVGNSRAQAHARVRDANHRNAAGHPRDGEIWRGPTDAAWTKRILRGAAPPRESTRGEPQIAPD